MFTKIQNKFIISGASFTIPKHWQKMDEKENLKIVTLNQQDAEYKKVLGELTKTLGRTPNIVKVRFMFTLLYRIWCL